jgi:hypothetical protein
MLDQGVGAESSRSSFSLDSQPSWPYYLNHKQVLTVAFPSNLILPYIALVNNKGPVSDSGRWCRMGPSGPVLNQRYTGIWPFPTAHLRNRLRLLLPGENAFGRSGTSRRFYGWFGIPAQA